MAPARAGGPAPGTVSFELWGGTATVATTDPAAAEAAAGSVRDVVATFDLACSSFREDSELAAVNRAGGRPVAVGPVLLEALAAALRAAELTGGDVDPTVGRALIAHGFTPGDPAAGHLATGFQIEEVPGIETVRLDAAAGTVSVARGVVLDLGATAKALAADRAAEAAAAAVGCGVLVSLLGDLATAGPAPAGGWQVRVTDDHRAGEDAAGQTVAIAGGGLATSSTAVRRRGALHHLIDPRTGAPARSPLRTASVTAASCLDANIAASAAIIRGERAAEWLESLGLASRLVYADGTVSHLAGWPPAGEELPGAGSRRAA